MRIEKFDVYYVKMPLIYPWRTAYGADYDIHSVLVKATSGEHEGWAESTPFFAPTYLPESAGTVFYQVTEIFAPYLVGQEFETAEDVNKRLAIFKGNSFGKAAVEITWWTLQSAITKTPLHRLLGGETREVQAGADFGIQDSIDMLLGNIQKAVDAGFPRIKLKVGRGWDLEMLKAVTSTFPKMTFHIDCNSGYTLDDLPFFKAIDNMGLAFIEQPLHFNDVLDHAELAKQIQTPVCLDETIVSVKAAEQALQIGACKYINIKPGRIGGLSNAIAVHNMARDAGVPVWIGGMLESALGGAICVEVATLPNFTYPGDLFPSARFYHEDLSKPYMELTKDLTFAPFTKGLPTPDPEKLKTQTVWHKTVEHPLVMRK
ncbi:MAG: o-succinylbenzoate synthase [Chloroflexi bacterium]|nr:o-succinylbenzoate synthase [Chloroflexota bacterium]